jgi:hypothetical protein
VFGSGTVWIPPRSPWSFPVPHIQGTSGSIAVLLAGPLPTVALLLATFAALLILLIALFGHFLCS